ncbi:MAG: hypothetical protein ABIQ16_05370, partial [Polyangiaceae bacterium]
PALLPAGESSLLHASNGWHATNMAVNQGKYFMLVFSSEEYLRPARPGWPAQTLMVSCECNG